MLDKPKGDATMLRILADHNVEGHVQLLIRVCSSPEWADIWMSLACQIDSFEELGIPTRRSTPNFGNFARIAESYSSRGIAMPTARLL